MKLFFTLIMSLALLSCAQKTNIGLSDDEKKRMREEIQPVIEQIYDAAAHADTAKLFAVFHFDDNDFTFLEINGALYKQAQYKEMAGQFYGLISTEIIDKGTDRFDFIDENNVMWNYSGVLTVVYKTGVRVKYEPFGLTILFRKINHKWKGVFLQESTQEPPLADSTKH